MKRPKKQIFTIDIHCSRCRNLLYRYRKEGGGSLVKCFVDGITIDKTERKCHCPTCDTPFAREAMMQGRPVHKIIQGKVFVVGSTGKKK